MSTSYVTAEKREDDGYLLYTYKYIDKNTGRPIISHKKYKPVDKDNKVKKIKDPSKLSKVELRKTINDYIKTHSAEEVKILCDILQNENLISSN